MQTTGTIYVWTILTENKWPQKTGREKKGKGVKKDTATSGEPGKSVNACVKIKCASHGGQSTVGVLSHSCGGWTRAGQMGGFI